MARRFLALGFILVALILISSSQTSPPVSHSASEVAAGEFQAGDYVFNGQVRVNAPASSFGLNLIQGGNTADNGLYMQGVGGVSFRIFVDGDTDKVHFARVASPKLTIDADGNVGVGTTSPAAPLHVLSTSNPQAVVAYDENNFLKVFHAGGASGGVNLQVVGENTAKNLQVVANSLRVFTEGGGGPTFEISNDGTDARISVSVGGTDFRNLLLQPDGGNVGVGTTVPGELFHVEGGNVLVQGGNPKLKLSSSSSGGSSHVLFGDSDNEAVGEIAYYHNLDAMRFYVTGGEMMRLDSGGNLKLPAISSVEGGGSFLCIDASDNVYRSTVACDT